MSSYDLSHITDVGMEFSSGPSVSIWDMVQQGYRQQYRVDSQRALDEELRTRWAESLRALSAAGQRFNAPVDPLMYRGFAQFVRDGTPVTTPTVEGSGYGARINYDAQQPSPEFEEMRRANEAIRQLNNPDIRTFEQILEEVSEMQRGVEEQTASMSERAGWSGFIFGELPGAIAGSFTTRDPLNIVTAPIGAGRTIATRIASDMAIAAGVVTATEFGDVAPNRALAGLPERDPLLNIVAATAGAGFIRGGLIEPAAYGIRRLRERPTVEDIDFDLRDSGLRELFEADAGPTARAGAQALDDITFIERNNPYGEGQAAQARFLAELQEVQRVMGGEPMTAIARVLPPLPFEYIQKAADFEIVREQAPLVYARMEQAQARLNEIETRLESEVSDLRTAIDSTRQAEPINLEEFKVEGNERFLIYTSPSGETADIHLIIGQDGRTEIAVNANMKEQSNQFGVAEVRRVSEALKEKYPEITEFFGERETGAGAGRTQTVAARRSANAEYQAAYRAMIKAETRLREQQARIEAAQQREAVHIFADATYGRPFNWSALQYDHVQARVDAINAFNDTLDEKAVALFVRQMESERSVTSTTPLYHGTAAKFKEFDLAQKGTGASKGIKTSTADGIYLTGDKNLAANFVKNKPGAHVRTVYADLRNPYMLQEGELITSELGERVKKLGHDGIIREFEGKPLEVVVFDPKRITDEPVTSEAWLTADGRVDIGLREPVDPEFRITTDDGDMSIAEAMRDLQDDADLDEAMRTCLR